MKKVFFSIIFFFLLFTSFSSASTVFSESFTYSDAFSNHGWIYSEGSSNCFYPPFYSGFPIYNRSYGLNGTSTCGATSYIATNFSNTSMSSGIMELSFDYYSNDSSGLTTEQPIFLDIGHKVYGGIANLSYRISIYQTGELRITPQTASVTGGTACSIMTTNAADHSVIVHFDFPKGTYYVLIDGGLYCSEYASGKPRASIYAISINSQWNSGYKYIVSLDDLLITSATSSYGNNTPQGYPCTQNSDCESKKCYMNHCVLGNSEDPCTLNSQCMSGVCYAGKCTNPGVWAQTDQLLGFFAPDSTSKMFIAIIIMILSVGVILYFLRSMIAFGLILAAVIFFIELLFFTIVGYLSAWILVIMIMLLIVLVILLVFLKSSAGG